MISKPPDLGEKDPKDWIKDFLGYFERVRFEFMLVEGLWFPAQSTEQHGFYPAHLLTAAEAGYISAIIPRGTSEIKEAVIRIIPTTTGTIDWTADASFGGKNEDESAITSTKTADGLAVTDDRMTEIDVTSLFVSARENQQVGIRFTLDVLSTTTNVYLLGLYLKIR